jgi:hypothetical protein
MQHNTLLTVCAWGIGGLLFVWPGLGMVTVNMVLLMFPPQCVICIRLHLISAYSSQKKREIETQIQACPYDSV